MTSDELFALKPQFDADFARRKQARKLERMHVLYGKREDARCGDCVQFIGREYAGKYFKCRLFGDSAGPATDWRVRYVACGKFERRDVAHSAARSKA